MRKITVTLGLLLSVSIVAWVYLATKFEQIAKNEILPRIKSGEYIVSADTDSAIIEKFKFRITLKDVTLFPKSKALKIFSNQIVACYNPFNDKIVAKFVSDKFKSGSGKTEIYFTAQDKKVEFNRPLLNNNFEDINIHVSTGESKAYFASDHSEISHLKKSNMSLVSKLDKDGFYNADLKLSINGIESSPGSKYAKYMLEELLPNLAQEKNSHEKRYEKIEEYYGKIVNKLGPIDYNSDSSIKLGQKHVENIVAALNGELDPVELYKSFSFTSDNYLFSIKETYGNAYTHDSLSYMLAGNGKTVTSDLNMLLTKNYSDEQKKDIGELLLEFANSMTSQNFLPEDLKGLTDKYLNTKKINLLFNISYDVESHNANHSLEFKIDNLAINSDGSLKEHKYDGNFKLATPKLLISGISDLYDGGIKLLMQRKNADISNINLVIEDIKNNGMELLSAFDKKDSLKDEDNFESSFSFNLENFEFKVNGKGLIDLLTDERVVKFLKDIPKTDQN